MCWSVCRETNPTDLILHFQFAYCLDKVPTPLLIMMKDPLIEIFGVDPMYTKHIIIAPNPNRLIHLFQYLTCVFHLGRTYGYPTVGLYIICYLYCQSKSKFGTSIPLFNSAVTLSFLCDLISPNIDAIPSHQLPHLRNLRSVVE